MTTPEIRVTPDEATAHMVAIRGQLDASKPQGQTANPGGIDPRILTAVQDQTLLSRQAITTASGTADNSAIAAQTLGAQDRANRTRILATASLRDMPTYPKNLDEALFPPGTAPGPPPSLLDKTNAQRMAAGQPPLNSLRDDPEFMATARSALAKQGLSPAQIEQQIDATVKYSEQPMVSYKPPEAPRLPPPGFGEGFGDRWRSTEQGIKNLIGQGGPGAPGVLESWKGVNDSLAETLTNPVGAIKDEVDHFRNSPSLAYYLGEKSFDAGATAATLPFGGEGAAVRAGLPAEIATAGGAPTALLRGWDPVGGMEPAQFQQLFGTPETRGAFYPGNDGFPPGYTPVPADLPAGTIIDRFGSEWGQYLSPDGTPFAHRALPPETVGGTYTRYIVTGEPLPPGWNIVKGPVEPAFGQTPPPDAVQYKIVGPDGVQIRVRDLLQENVIREDGPPLGR